MKFYNIIVIILTLVYTISCQNNQTEKHKSYWDENHSKLQMEYETKNNLRHGESLSYYPNGQLKSLVYYENGRISNVSMVFDTTGNKLYYGNLKNGQGFVIMYDDYGVKKASGNYKNGFKNGLWSFFNPKGEINDQFEYVNGYLVINGIKTYDNLYY